MKYWKHIDWSDECPKCGSGVSVLTDCQVDNEAYDGDEARCEECGLAGWVSIVDTAYINWKDWKK
jgi:transcription elongation factor Elf1